MTTEGRYGFDTSVIVSALLRPGSVPRQAFDLATERGVMLASVATLSELREVLFRPKFDRYITLQERLQFLAALMESVVLIDVDVTIAASRDAKDNKFLELAVSGQATCLVSGDEDLLILHPFRGIEILSPAAFLQRKG
ncbi:putative toxin-antitoxin system toxin component, PIN family [Leptolyngbya iicbica]|uniref:Putative toxin-antitoxin system toxin component, PIN family n=2 Tax=Cyanophyceae TaxID=3028117 RepID=A0A4Q7E798_9CYAN|nr:putative toxin-antitoxin system toxin component, PIN family [Leptolyngbya sp. LK]RZM78617.1 putative toxin-antitoxin system toxin component, PIN family [Leptolyngbya sp. LK]